MHTKIYRVVQPISVDVGVTFSLYENEMFEFCNNKITKLTYQRGGKKHELEITRRASNLIYYKSWVTLYYLIELGGIIEDVTEQIKRDRALNKILE